MAEEKEQTFEFQSEVKQLLDILVYSLYKNKEVFLRELVSNAADALNKMQFEFLTVPDLEGRDQELKITIAVDKKHGKLVVEDNGVGMTREELVQNIGTIAHSGTLDYLKRLQESQAAGPADLIGKFGVGFYSSFMVAKEIHIVTRSWQKDGQAWLWKSSGESGYTIEAAEKEGRGTRIELLLKKDEKEFLEAYRLKNIILKHSKFVPFPIYLDGEKIERHEAVWTQPKSKLADKDYADFYKFFENTQEEPETWLHLSSDAPVQFHSLLYVPKTSFELLGLMKERARRRPLCPQGPHPEGLQGDHARVPALRQGHHRLRGDPAEHLARDVPEQRAHRQDPQARGEEAAGAPGGAQGEGARQVPRHLEELRQEPQGGRGQRLRQPRQAGAAAPLFQLQDRRRRADRPEAVRRPHGRGTEGDLLPGRRRPPDDREEPGPGDLPQEGLRGPVPDRSPRRVRPRPSARVRQEALQDGRERRHPPGGEGDGRRRGDRKGRRRTWSPT